VGRRGRDRDRDNILESEGKGGTLDDMYEDYSCKGPSAPSSPSAPTVSEQDEGVCYTVNLDNADLDDPVTRAARDDLLAQGYKGDPNDSYEMLYSPECFTSEAEEEDEGAVSSAHLDRSLTPFKTNYFAPLSISPTYSSAASAWCWDGTYSTSTGRGTCSGHGGIYTYL
jgi:hypothetical protein